MHEEIKLIVFLKMMKKITQWADWQDQAEFSRYPVVSPYAAANSTIQKSR
jgi:hypothetical protein